MYFWSLLFEVGFMKFEYTYKIIGWHLDLAMTTGYVVNVQWECQMWGFRTFSALFKPKAKHPTMYPNTNKQTNKKTHLTDAVIKKEKILHLYKRNASVSCTIKLPSLLHRQNFQHLQLLQYHPKHNRKEQKSHKVIIGFQTFLRITHGLALKGVVSRLSSSFC